MDLPNLFSNSAKSTTEELVLFLLLSDAKLQVSLLELSKSGVHILSKSHVLEYEGLDACVSQTDTALQQLDKRSDKISEIVFAVNTSWVKDGEVIDEKKPFVKKLTEELSLKPLGFIDSNESIAQQKVAENSLFSGIVVFITKIELLFTLIYQGKIKKTEAVGSSGVFKSDFAEGIARVHKLIEKKGNYLPSKLFFTSFEFSDQELHDFQQEIYGQDWEENKFFLQAPTIEVLTHDQFLTDISKEAGKNAAMQKGLTDFALAASMTPAREHAVETLNSSEFGFSDPLHADSDVSDSEMTEAPTSFGIPIKTAQPELAIELDEQVDTVGNVLQVDDTFLENAPETIVLDKKKSKKDWGHKKNIKWFAILGVFLGLLCLFGVVAFGAPFFSSTEVTVVLNKKLVSKDIELTLDTKAKETDVEKLIIAANTITKKATDTNTVATTGIKIVGENAKGKVKINNKTPVAKNFSKGTQLKYGELLFELNDEIAVPPSSTTSGTWGNADVAVTALQIGAESNTAKDSELTIESYDTSSYNAIVIDEGLTGGSSREVRIVAQKDMDDLLKDLREELVERINEEFSAESGNGTYILPSKSIVDEVATYDNKIETEAESLTLELEIEVEAVTYSGGDLKPVAQEILSQDLPENYELEDSDPQILSSPSQTDLDKLESEAVVSIDANISAYAIPQLTEDSIRSEIAGKSFTDATQQLVAKTEISSVTFHSIPKVLSGFVKRVSSSTNKIVVLFTK